MSEQLTFEELKDCFELRVPIIIEGSYKFNKEPTHITSLKENYNCGGLVKVEGSDDLYEGYRIRIFKDETNTYKYWINNGRTI